MRVKPPGGNHLQWGRYFAANGRNRFMVTLLPGHPPPPGGPYEIQVQIQDGGARNSNVATGHVIRNTSQCSSWQNDGPWHLRMAKLAVPVPRAAQATPQPRCRFGFFKGKSLRYGWRLAPAAFARWSREPATWVVERAIKPIGLDAWFSIAGTGTGAKGSGEIRVSTLVFEGPPGSKWQDAFKP